MKKSAKVQGINVSEFIYFGEYQWKEAIKYFLDGLNSNFEPVISNPQISFHCYKDVIYLKYCPDKKIYDIFIKGSFFNSHKNIRNPEITIDNNNNNNNNKNIEIALVELMNDKAMTLKIVLDSKKVVITRTKRQSNVLQIFIEKIDK